MENHIKYLPLPLILLLTATSVVAVTQYDLTQIGLTDSEHTSAVGEQWNITYQLNVSGQAIGRAARFIGTKGNGYSSWLYSNGSNIQIGLIGDLQTRFDGYRDSTPLYLNEAGQVAGESTRYNDINGYGLNYIGTSAWIFSDGSTSEIGLTDSEHMRSDGQQENTVIQLNVAGQVLGEANRYNGASSIGNSVWIYSGATTTEAGLRDSEHTRDDGTRYSNAIQLNETGQAIGNSTRFNRSISYYGSSAWIFNDGNTTKIGLTGSVHTRGDGVQLNVATQLNNVGQVIGRANRYDGSNSLGQSAWLYSNGVTIEIGLTDAGHTDSNGNRFNTPTALNQAGQVVGFASRYKDTLPLGNSAWIYNSGVVTEIGLTDAYHTGSKDVRSSKPTQINEAGQVIGDAYRFQPRGGYLGNSAWIYNNGTTTEIGLTDSQHTRSDGHQENTAIDLNQSGQVMGAAKRYSDMNASGESVWFYDDDLDQIFTHEFSVKSDGFSRTFGEYLGDDGLMLGYYLLFDDLDNYIGQRAFSFTIEDGWNDLNYFVNDGLDYTGWSYLASAIGANSWGQIIGTGDLEGVTGQAAYMLTPSAVPIPAAVWMFCGGLVCLLGFAKKQAAVRSTEIFSTGA